MLFFFRRRPKPDPDDIVEESWKTDFRKPANSRFQPEGGDGYTVSVERGSVDLRLSRRNLFAWAEDPLYRYRDFSLSGTFSFLEGAYASAGFIFRYVDPSTFYYCLVSNRGFFRLDGVFNGSPFTLIPWTPVPEPLGERFSLRIIVLDTRILVAIEEAWAAEIEDDRIDAGRVGFACQNYDQSDTAALRLMELDIDSRPVSAAALFERWSEYIPVDPAARIRLAENLYAAGQPLGAVVQLKKALREGTLAPEGYFLLAESFLGLGMLDEASRSVEKAAEAAPENEQYQMEKGNLLYLRNEFGRLAPFAEELRNRFPENHLAWNLSGHASYHGGDWDGAYRYYGEAWKLEGELPLYGANSARSAVMSGKTEEGMRLYGEAASACFRQEAYEECADLIAAAEKAAPLTPVLLSLKGKILFQKGELIEASAIFNRLVKRKEADSSIHFLLGLTQCAGEEREKGIRHLKKAAEMDPDVPVYWYKLAENLHLSGKNPEKELERALELAPGDCWVYNLQGLVERERGNGKGLEFFAKAHELCPGEIDILINYSQALFENGSAAEAFSLLETGGDSPEIRNQKGNLLFASGKYEEAAAEYEEALKQAPENRTYMENAAEAAARNGSISRAETLFGALQEKTNDPWWYYRLGNLALQKGEFQRAGAAFREAYARDPENGRYRVTLARHHAARKEYDEARALLVLPGDSPFAPEAREVLAQIERETEDRVICSLCGRIWRVPRDIGPQDPVILHGEPLGASPAGQCPECGAVYCVECALPFLREDRFVCMVCGKPLKLSDPRLRYLARHFAEDPGDPGQEG